MDDRQLLEREMMRLTAAGWEIVSQSDLGFQAKMGHVVSSAWVVFLVFLPALLGILAVLFSALWASALFTLALVGAALVALHHVTVAPKLLYISAEQLRGQAGAR